MLTAILRIIANLSGWWSPERSDKRLRAKKKEIEKELRALKRQPWSYSSSKKVERLENELQKIIDKLSS